MLKFTLFEVYIFIKCEIFVVGAYCNTPLLAYEAKGYNLPNQYTKKDLKGRNFIFKKILRNKLIVFFDFFVLKLIFLDCNEIIF